MPVPALQSSSEPTTADSTHEEETHSDDSIGDADETAARLVYSWEKPHDAIPCADEWKSGDYSSSVRSCAGSDDDEIKSESYDDKLHLGFKCNECDGEIFGYRYTCVQCCGVELCGACEASGAHPEHYVLRLPRPERAGKLHAVLETLRGLLDPEPLIELPPDRIKTEVDDEDPLHEPTDLRSPEATDDESDDYKAEEQEEEKFDPETLSTDSKETHTDAVVANTAQMQHQTNEEAPSTVKISSPVKKKILPIIRVSKHTQVKMLLVDSGVIKFDARVGPGQAGVGISGAGAGRGAAATVGGGRASEARARLAGGGVQGSRAGTAAPGTDGMVSIPAPKRVVKLTRPEATAFEEAKRRKITLLRKVI